MEFFYNFLKSLPVLQASGHPVFIERFATVFIPPLFGIPIPSLIDERIEAVDHVFEMRFAGNTRCVKVFED